MGNLEEMYAKMNPAKAKILKQLEAQTKGIEMKAAAPFVMQAMQPESVIYSGGDGGDDGDSYS